MSYGQYNNNPYQQGPETEANYGQGQYEMQPYTQQQPPPASVMTMQEFLNQVQYIREEIQRLTSDLDNIAMLHQRALGATDSGASQQLEHYVTQTQLRNTQIKDQIKSLEYDLAKTQDSSRSNKLKHVNNIKGLFKSELEKYQSIESDYQKRYREQIARQYRIVNPDASPQEIEQATQADWGQGVFQTALQSNQSAHASTVLGAVRARQNELQRIEQTLIELSQLFQELATMVELQDPIVERADQNATNTVENIDHGNKEIQTANEHARRRRKLKWWCLGITILIIIIIALGVGIGVSQVRAAANRA